MTANSWLCSITHRAKESMASVGNKGENQTLLLHTEWSGNKSILRCQKPTQPAGWILVLEPHQHHDVQICHLMNPGFAQDDDGACGVQAPPPCSARHLNVLACPTQKKRRWRFCLLRDQREYSQPRGRTGQRRRGSNLAVDSWSRCRRVFWCCRTQRSWQACSPPWRKSRWQTAPDGRETVFITANVQWVAPR